MQRYQLFAGNNRYPAGGFDDYIGSRKSIDAVKKLLITCRVGGYHQPPEWAHIVDTATMNRVWTFRNREWIKDNAGPSNCWSNDP